MLAVNWHFDVDTAENVQLTGINSHNEYDFAVYAVILRYTEIVFDDPAALGNTLSTPDAKATLINRKEIIIKIKYLYELLTALLIE